MPLLSKAFLIDDNITKIKKFNISIVCNITFNQYN